MNTSDKSTYDNYTKVEIPADTHIERCPVCASVAEPWRYSESPDSKTATAVCCSNSEPIGPQANELCSGCLLYMPPEEFYRATLREALKYWNEYAKQVGIIQRKNRWSYAKVLRNEQHE